LLPSPLNLTVLDFGLFDTHGTKKHVFFSQEVRVNVKICMKFSANDSTNKPSNPGRKKSTHYKFDQRSSKMFSEDCLALLMLISVKKKSALQKSRVKDILITYFHISHKDF
jgi:hypothetical protein